MPGRGDKERFYTDNRILNVYFVLSSVPDTCHASIYSHTTTISFTEKKNPKLREIIYLPVVPKLQSGSAEL